MAKRKTTEEFVEECKALYEEGFDYKEVDYQGQKFKVTITCPKGHKFDTWPGNFLRGRGCTTCGNLTKGQHSKPTTEQFIKECSDKHNSKYSYPNLVYTDNKSKIDVVCPSHGVFSVVAGVHKRGVGCPACYDERRGDTTRLTKEEFITSSQEAHGTRYDYSSVEYKNGHTKVAVTCRTHGPFNVTPSNHLNGSGCPHCAPSGYNPSKVGYLYVFVGEGITKVGITNKLPHNRLKQVSRHSGIVFNVKTYICFEDGSIAEDVEHQVLKILRQCYEPVATKFDGHTECFMNIDYNDLLKIIVSATSERLLLATTR